MAEKRKISVRKILQVLLTVVVSTCCIIAMVSASNIEGSKNLVSVAVHIKNDKKYHFIEQKQIMDLAINNRHVDIMHTPLSRLDIHGIEQVIKSDPWVAEAQAFIDMNRVLHMYVTQRIPVARLFEQDSKSYYMDATLSTMPLSATNIYYTMVVTNVPPITNDSAGTALKMQIYTLAKAIQADTFWNAQVSQIVVDSFGLFELIPVIGNQKIIFGDTSNAKEKLHNLFAFYKNVLNRIGWDKYETLDLRFNGQVVASPSLPYKGVSDKAVDKMNWINSIIITEAQNDTKDSLRTAILKGTDNGAAHTGAVQVKTAIAKTAVAAGVVGAGILAAKQIKKADPGKAGSKARVQPAKPTAAAKQVTKPLAPGKQVIVKQGVKPPSAPFGKGTVVAKPGEQSKAGDKSKPAEAKQGVKPPSAPFGKGAVVAKPGEQSKVSDKTKPADKAKPVANAADKKKAGDKKQAVDKKKAADKKKNGKAATKNVKSKPIQKKNAAVANSKNKAAANKDSNTKQGKPKYAYPENKGH